MACCSMPPFAAVRVVWEANGLKLLQAIASQVEQLHGALVQSRCIYTTAELRENR